MGDEEVAGNLFKNESFVNMTIISKSLKTKFKGNTLGDKYKLQKKSEVSLPCMSPNSPSEKYC